MTKQLIAYHGSHQIKEKYVQRMKKHMELDHLIYGTYWDKETQLGCAVGCCLESSKNVHKQCETKLGVPAGVAKLEDRIYERSFHVYSQQFPLRFLEAIPVGADLMQVLAHMVLATIESPEFGVLPFTGPETRKIGEQVVLLYQRWIAQDDPSAQEWSAARSTAYEAITHANDVYERSCRAADTLDIAATYTIFSATVESFATAESYCVALHAQRGVARSKLYSQMGERLLSVLERAPLVAGCTPCE